MARPLYLSTDSITSFKSGKTKFIERKTIPYKRAPRAATPFVKSSLLAGFIIFIGTNASMAQVKTSGEQTGDTLRVLDQETKEVMLNPSPKHFAASFKSIFIYKANLFFLITGAGLSVAMRPYDNDLSESLKDDNFNELELRGPAFLGKFYTLASATVLTHLLGRAIHSPSLANTGLYLFDSYLTTQLLTFAVKETVHRTRPNGENRLSFPSGHASGAFAIASVLDVRYGYKAGIPSYLLAAVIGLSRVKMQQHYPTDVIAGATLGIIVGRSIPRSPVQNKSVIITPSLNPEAPGLNLLLVF